MPTSSSKKKTVPVISIIFKVLHDLIIDVAKTFKDPDNRLKFDPNEDIKAVYGIGENIRSSSIAAQMIKKFDLKNHKANGFNLPFNGKRLYGYFLDFENEIDEIDIKENYLSIYCQFVGYPNFKQFLSGCEKLKSEWVTEQEKILKKASVEKPEAPNSENNSSQVKDHFYGVYEGFFLRPAKKNKTADRLSKLTLLLNKDSHEVYVKTTKSITSTSIHYKGTCKINGHVFTMKFIINGYEFYFVFDITERINPENFDGYLKGIYGGSDPITEKPVCGRLILMRDKKWEELIAICNEDSPKQHFLKPDNYTPSDLTDDEAFELLYQKKFGMYKNDILGFFMIEDRYIENIKAIEKYSANKATFKNIAGIYSIYSLQSKGRYLNISPSRIFDSGIVQINGRIDDTTVRIYEGTARLIAENRLSIMVRKRGNPDDICFHYIKVDTSENDDEEKWFNGVRIMKAEQGEFKPFAGRVIFIKEADSKGYDEKNAMESIPLFPTNDEQMKQQRDFLAHKDRAILLEFLRGPENNIIKTFDDIKNRTSRDIDYGETFLQMAKYYVQRDKRPQAIINLYYAQMHGRNHIKDLDDMKEYFGITGQISMESSIEIYQVGNEIFYRVIKKKIK